MNKKITRTKSKASVLIIIILLIISLLLGFILCKNLYHDRFSVTADSDIDLILSVDSGFVVEDLLAQTVQIVSKKTLNYVFESDIAIGPGETKSYESILGDGSGIFVSKDGLILTNKHVVSDSDARYEVVLLDGSSYTVDKIWYHDSLDLALINIADYSGDAIENVAVFAEDVDAISVSDTVFAVGTLFGKYAQAMSAGIVSKLNVDFDFEGMSYKGLLLSDVLVSPGSSGGPLFNEFGEVIAIVTAQNNFGGSYAIPFSRTDINKFIEDINTKM